MSSLETVLFATPVFAGIAILIYCSGLLVRDRRDLKLLMIALNVNIGNGNQRQVPVPNNRTKRQVPTTAVVRRSAVQHRLQDELSLKAQLLHSLSGRNDQEITVNLIGRHYYDEFIKKHYLDVFQEDGIPVVTVSPTGREFMTGHLKD